VRFPVAEGGGQHADRGVFFSCPDERIRVVTRSMTRHCGVGGLPRRKTFDQVNGLSCAASGEQSADADLADGKSVEEDFVSFIGLQGHGRTVR